jgi:putative membrane protein
MKNFPKIILILEILALIITGIFNQAGLSIWALEVFPAVLVTGILIFTYNKFRFSNFVYLIIFLHSLVLMYGGMYTYAQTPLGFYISDLFDWGRNNYDKLGHFMQGFTPMFVALEYFTKREIIKGKFWTYFLSIFMILGFAALYEMIEWWIALVSGSVGDAFLGTQGYVFDTQNDMFLCLIGSIVAFIFIKVKYNK